MRTKTRSTLCLLAVSVVVLTLSACWLSTGALAGKGGNKGGGKGGGGTGEEPLANPAFVYEDVHDDGLFLTTADGTGTFRLTKPPRKGSDTSATWAPDGSRIAFLSHPDTSLVWVDLYTVRPDGTGLTFIRAFDSFEIPVPRKERLAWSPVGDMIVYASEGLMAVDVATGSLQLVYDYGPLFNVGHPDFSPDFDPDTPGYQGTLAFRAVSDPEVYQVDIWLLDVEIGVDGSISAGNLRNLTDSLVEQDLPAWSPDGQFLAFIDRANYNETTETDIVVMNLATELAWVVTTIAEGGPSQPDWSPDGEYICFSAPHEVNGFVSYDVFRVSPWDLSAQVFNVTGTDSWRDREVDPRWNPAWVNNIDP